MAAAGSAFDQAGSEPSISKPSKERHSPPDPGTGKNGQTSTGACDACRLRKVCIP